MGYRITHHLTHKEHLMQQTTVFLLCLCAFLLGITVQAAS